VHLWSKELKFCFYTKLSHTLSCVLFYIHRNWALELSQLNLFPTNYFNSLLHLSKVPNTFRNFRTVIFLSSTQLSDTSEKPNSSQTLFFLLLPSIHFQSLPCSKCMCSQESILNLFLAWDLPLLHHVFIFHLFPNCFPICNSNSLPYPAVRIVFWTTGTQSQISSGNL
jgi:hypothetical protein